MKNIKFLLMAALSMIVLNTHAQMLAKGVSKELADHRKANISNVVYDLTFNIPSDPNQRVTGKAVIRFDLKVREDLVLDFQGDFDGTCYYFTGKKENKRRAVEAFYQNEHIIIPMKALKEGKNKIELYESRQGPEPQRRLYVYHLRARPGTLGVPLLRPA